ncbi:hypothetical protein ACH42_03365 [Endozoicomonas sp. (ex Bugula neritina AB1)]|nr:hypothetical protein ACH42_03365 [Endozoicomonas sp. (ex Bugula neritina AB1)]
MTDLNTYTEQFFAALPVFGENLVGNAARKQIINRVQGATPGKHTQPWPQSSGPSFKKIFFPNWSDAGYTSVLNNSIGFDNNWWSDFAVVLLCQAMDNVTSSLTKQMKTDDINRQMNSNNQSMAPKMNGYYQQMLVNVADSPAKQPYTGIGSQKIQAATLYEGFLTSPAWISAKVSQYDRQQWPNQVWELFHHWNKLALLGKSNDQINSLINMLKSKGLPVPDLVSAGKWVNYTPWNTGGNISYKDIPEATPGILERICTVYMGSPYPSCMNEENSYEFTANSQPGSRWRGGGSSCFAAGATVVMGDGTLKAIETVTAGEEVMTPEGAKTVQAVVSLFHNREILYQINNNSFMFTSTHPFLAADTSKYAPKFAAIDPAFLSAAVPSLSADGIATLSANGPALAGYSNGKMTSVSVDSVTEHPVTTDNQTIYDLIVAFDDEGLSEYIVGDEQHQYLVSSEVPQFGKAPEATEVLIKMVTQAWPVVQNALKDVSADRWLQVLYQGLTAAQSSLMADAVREVQANAGNTQALTADAYKAHIKTMSNDLVASLGQQGNGGGAPVYDGQKGAFFAALLNLFGYEIRDTITAGWRDFTQVDDRLATQLALTVHNIELFADEALPLGQDCWLDIIFDPKGDNFSSPINLTSLGYNNPLAKVFYIDQWRPLLGAGNGQSQSWPVEALLNKADGTQLFTSGEFPLLGTIANGYRTESMPLKTANGHITGFVTFDVRPFASAMMLNEQTASQQWNSDKQQVFSSQLADAAAQWLVQRFDSMVGPYLEPRKL